MLHLRFLIGSQKHMLPFHISNIGKVWRDFNLIFNIFFTLKKIITEVLKQELVCPTIAKLGKKYRGNFLWQS